MASALCYLVGLVTGVLFLVLEPYNRDKTVRFHAFQSIFLSLAWFVCYIVAMVLAFIPFLGWVFSLLLTILLPLAFLALWLVLMYKAYNNEKLVLPIIGPMAEKQA